MVGRRLRDSLNISGRGTWGATGPHRSPQRKCGKSRQSKGETRKVPRAVALGGSEGDQLSSTTRITWLLEASSLSHTFRSLWLSGPLHPASVLSGRCLGPSTRAVVRSVSRGGPLAPPSNGLRPRRRLRHRGRDFRPRASLDLGTQELPGA